MIVSAIPSSVFANAKKKFKYQRAKLFSSEIKFKHIFFLKTKNKIMQ